MKVKELMDLLSLQNPEHIVKLYTSVVTSSVLCPDKPRLARVDRIDITRPA